MTSHAIAFVEAPLASLVTPSQTVGPFFHDCMLREGAQCDTTLRDVTAAAVRVTGRVLDGDAAVVPDAVLEVWQAGSGDFVRVGTNADGRFSFTMPEPVTVPFDETTNQAPHLSVAVFARGLLNHLFTRIYFADDPALDGDPILQRVPATRRPTLLAHGAGVDGLTRLYEFDIILQGDGETVFFDFQPSRR